MHKLLKDTYIKLEELKGKHLVFTLLALFSIFVLAGFIIGYFTEKLLNKNEPAVNQVDNTYSSAPEKYYEGKIMYLDPAIYPNQKISYYLADSAGRELMLLKSADQKLVLSEGLYVKVYGKMSNASDGKKVLTVDKVVLSNR